MPVVKSGGDASTKKTGRNQRNTFHHGLVRPLDDGVVGHVEVGVSSMVGL